MNIAAWQMDISRCPSPTYEDILRRDTRPVPVHLLEAGVPDIGTAPIAASRYTEAEFARSEERFLWPRIWQMACREDEVPDPGSMILYEVGARSLLVVRQNDGGLRAFHNSCLHRGRRLATADGCKSELRCPFHGIAWNLDGGLKDNPIGWDFGHWAAQEMSLPQAKVETWGGFVFINMDAEAPPLAAVLGPIQAHFERYHLEDCATVFRVQKKVRCNWKALAEAFMESHHTLATHPQLLGYLSDVNSQYDALSDHVTRQFSATMVASPLYPGELSEDGILQALMRAGSRGRAAFGAGGGELHVPDGSTARAFMAETTRSAISAADGVSYADCSDAEMVDALLYNLFPNMSFWAGYAPKLFYRWRPNGQDHETALMDIYMLKRVPQGQPRPAPPPLVQIGLDESIAELGPPAGIPPGLCTVFEQDMRNLPEVQLGMKASATGVVHFGRYAEMRIRLMHQMIDRYIEDGRAAAA